MTLLIVACIIYSILLIPAAVRYGQWLGDELSSTNIFSTLGLALWVVAVSVYLNSIGHGIVALIFFVPGIVTVIVGIAVAIADR